VACGVAVPAGGVAVLAGGVAVLAGGVAGEPGVEVCPVPLALLPVEVVLPDVLPPAAEPPAVLCATAQLAQHNTTESSVSLLIDI